MITPVAAVRHAARTRVSDLPACRCRRSLDFPGPIRASRRRARPQSHRPSQVRLWCNRRWNAVGCPRASKSTRAGCSTGPRTTVNWLGGARSPPRFRRLRQPVTCRHPPPLDRRHDCAAPPVSSGCDEQARHRCLEPPPLHHAVHHPPHPVEGELQVQSRGDGATLSTRPSDSPPIGSERRTRQDPNRPPWPAIDVGAPPGGRAGCGIEWHYVLLKNAVTTVTMDAAAAHACTARTAAGTAFESCSAWARRPSWRVDSRVATPTVGASASAESAAIPTASLLAIRKVVQRTPATRAIDAWLPADRFRPATVSGTARTTTRGR